MTMTMTITIKIVSITNFSIVIGSPRACPITGIQFELFVIGHL